MHPLLLLLLYTIIFFLFSTLVAQNYMRHSKSIPDASTGLLGTTTKKLTHKWPSTNLDSGISLYSDDLPYKIKDMKST